MSEKLCAAIVLAAGKGTRYKETKQDVIFRGKPLWRYAYETALGGRRRPYCCRR